MRKQVEVSQLVIGQRYWLDDHKDVSAVFKGIEDGSGSILFIDMNGPRRYAPRDGDGTIGFVPFEGFTFEPVES